MPVHTLNDLNKSGSGTKTVTLKQQKLDSSTEEYIPTKRYLNLMHMSKEKMDFMEQEYQEIKEDNYALEKYLKEQVEKEEELEKENRRLKRELRNSNKIKKTDIDDDLTKLFKNSDDYIKLKSVERAEEKYKKLKEKFSKH